MNKFPNAGVRGAAALTALLTMAAPVAAQGLLLPQDLGEPRQGLSVSLENDLLGGQGSDRWYTNGLHVAGSFRRGQEPQALQPLTSLGRSLFVRPGCRSTACDVTLVFGFGQNMYTPRRIDLAEPQLRDRPWAGWLHGSLGLSHYSGNRHRMLSLRAGPTGPASLAEEAQTWVHRHLTGSPRPLGWPQQLRPRLGVQLSFLDTRRFSIAGRVGLHASYGGTLGNTRTLARAGLGLHWSPADGEGLRHQPGTLDEGDFLVPDFNSVAIGSTWWQALRHTVFYGHVQGSWVAYNAFIEGDTFGGRPQIERRPLVTTTTLGLTIPVGSSGRHKLGLAVKRRSPEFTVRGEAGRDFYHRWGVLTWSVDFDVPGGPGTEKRSTP